MSLRTTMLVSAVALAPLAASANEPVCETVDGVIIEGCNADVPGAAGDGLGLPDLGALNVTNFVPALLPVVLGGAAVAAVVLDGNGSSNGTN